VVRNCGPVVDVGEIMTKPLLVFAAASKRSRLLDLLECQLKDADIPFYIHIYPRHSTWQQASTVEVMVANVDLAVSLGYEKVAMVDAFDMTFFGNGKELAEKITGNKVMFCADRNLVPPELGEENFPATGTPWRFVNGGGMVGTHEAIRAFADMIRVTPHAEEETNNTLLNRLLCSGGEPAFRIDSQGEMFCNAYLDAGELTVMRRRPWNRLTDNFPSFVHFAGRADPLPLLAQCGIDYEIPPERWMRGEFPDYH
jgi:hypothetical protein